MTTPDDELRALLHDEVAGVEPAPDAWERIQWKIGLERRRRTRTIRLAAVGTAAALVAAVLVSVVLLEDEGLDVVAGPDPTTPTSVTGDAIPAPVDAPGIFPFTTSAEADAYRKPAEEDPGHSHLDPHWTAEQFLRDYVGMTDFELHPFQGGDSRSGEVVATVRGVFETTVLVRQIGSSEAWTVIGASTDDLRVAEPESNQLVNGVVHVAGEARAFEGHVDVQVKERGRDGRALGSGFVTGSGGTEHGPFAGDVRFTETETGLGAVLFTTASAEDGAIQQVSAVPIRWTTRSSYDDPDDAPPGADGPPLVAARDDGLWWLTSSGDEMRRLLDPADVPAGYGGLALTPDGSAVYVGIRQDTCGGSVVRVPLAGGGVAEVARGLWPAVSPDGTKLAYVDDGNCNSRSELVVRTLSTGATQTWPELETDDGVVELPVQVLHPSWAPDNRHVAYQVQFEDGSVIQLHDTADPAEVTGNGTWLSPADEERVWELPAYAGTSGLLSVVERCCGFDGRDNAIIQLDDGRADGTPDGEVGSLRNDIGSGRIVDLDWDVAAERPLWIVGDPDGAVHGTLWALVDGEPRLISDRVIVAEW